MTITTTSLGLFALGFLVLIAVIIYLEYRNLRKQIQRHWDTVNSLNDQVVNLVKQNELDELTITNLRTELQKQINDNLELHNQFEPKLAAAMKQWEQVQAPAIRAAALAKQKQVRTGFTSEAFAPFAIPDFAAEDYFRIGGSIDYLILDGADAVRDRRANEVNNVILLDIKTGKADLNTVQRRIRDAVVAGRVVFATYNMDTQEMRTWQQQTLIQKSQKLES